jgi:hypothetical protein
MQKNNPDVLFATADELTIDEEYARLMAEVGGRVKQVDTILPPWQQGTPAAPVAPWKEATYVAPDSAPWHQPPPPPAQ